MPLCGLDVCLAVVTELGPALTEHRLRDPALRDPPSTWTSSEKIVGIAVERCRAASHYANTSLCIDEEPLIICYKQFSVTTVWLLFSSRYHVTGSHRLRAGRAPAQHLIRRNLGNDRCC
ncbi:hypothetical protein EVAR_6965_1 [Eumeta japonica]|uniref:Uncharacterized protein n=1 Tax=Eumeta variegata TaxID=151549 RepID=A0A4C1TJL3_EUMVA|nr:hypothetical protein EVAR_6965_1 [Eumeta japonica]